MDMRDSEVVTSIVAGDPEGLAAAYDRYADPLYQYCRTLLRDPAAAADAVQDTFAIAASRLAGLRDPDRLRAWFYATARSESLRMLRSGRGEPALDQASGVSDDRADVGRSASRGEPHALLDDAAGGLSPGERELIELRLRQGLEPAEVASVLGVSRSHARTLLSRARDQLAVCLGVLLVGRAGSSECGELGAMLAGWDGRLTVPLRKRLHRHIENCATCSDRRARELRPAMLPDDLTPGAGLAAGAASFRLAAGAPAGLKAHTIALATGRGPGAVAHRAAVLGHAGAFGRQGFPKPRSSPRGQAAVAAVGLAVIIAAAALALTTSDPSVGLAAGPKPPPVSAGGPASALASASPAVTVGERALTPTATAPGAATAGGPRTATTTAPATAAPTSQPTPIPASPAPSSPGPSPAPTAPSTSPSPSASPSPSPAGTLAMVPRGGPLLVRPGGTRIFLFATGGTVDWSVTVANDPGSVIGVSPPAGILSAAAATATVTVTASKFVPCVSSSDPTITIEPGGAQYFVCTGWTQPFPGGGGHGHHHSGDALQPLTCVA